MFLYKLRFAPYSHTEFFIINKHKPRVYSPLKLSFGQKMAVYYSESFHPFLNWLPSRYSFNTPVFFSCKESGLVLYRVRFHSAHFSSSSMYPIYITPLSGDLRCQNFISGYQIKRLTFIYGTRLPQWRSAERINTEFDIEF